MPERRRMQGLALESAQGADEPRCRAARQAETAAIDRIADDGVLDVRQVQANLMRAAGLQFHAQIGMRPKALQHPIMRHRRPPRHADRHAQPIAPMTPDGLIDGAAARS